MNTNKRIYILLPAVLFFSLTYAQTDNAEFPKEIVTPGKLVIIICQPQPENLSGIKATGHSAVSIRKGTKAEPVFSGVCIQETDKDNRAATCRAVEITNAGNEMLIYNYHP